MADVKKDAYEYMVRYQAELLLTLADLIQSGESTEEITNFANAYLDLQPNLAQQIKLSAEYMSETGVRPAFDNKEQR